MPWMSCSDYRRNWNMRWGYIWYVFNKQFFLIYRGIWMGFARVFLLSIMLVMEMESVGIAYPHIIFRFLIIPIIMIYEKSRPIPMLHYLFLSPLLFLLLSKSPRLVVISDDRPSSLPTRRQTTINACALTCYY